MSRTQSQKRITEDWQPGMMVAPLIVREVKTRQDALDFLERAGISTKGLETKDDINRRATENNIIFPVYEGVE